MKHPSRLDDSKDERVRLQEELDVNRSLAVAHYPPEALRRIWQQSTKVDAAGFLKGWYAIASASGIRVLCTMANTLEGYHTGVLNWYDCPISSGPVEEINNKVGAMQRMAYE